MIHPEVMQSLARILLRPQRTGGGRVADECERQPGETIAWDSGGRLVVVALWWCPAGRELRVVRWQLRGRERILYQWARGQDLAAVNDAEATEWIAGVALERRDSPAGRWSTIQRQELTASDLAEFAARLRGWEAGLLDRADKLARRMTHAQEAENPS